MIASLYAPILALIYLALSGYVIAGRFKYKVSLGTGGIDDMEKRARVHSNFAEYVPLIVIMLILLDMTPMANWAIHTAYIALIVSRLCHAAGVLWCAPINPFRMTGVIGTLSVLLFTACALLYQYFFPPVMMMP